MGSPKSRGKKQKKEKKPKEKWTLATAFSKASWGVRMAKAFAPSVELNARNRVKVGVRIRPMSDGELRRKPVEERDNPKSVGFLELETDVAQVTLKNPKPPAQQEQKVDYFAFDNLYGPAASTEQVFKDLALPLVHLLVAGYNGTIFAYGQTGSGKTHSMMGSSSDPGIVPRTCAALFETISEFDVKQMPQPFVVKASYLQIYREVLHDLLSGSSLDKATDASRDHGKDLKIRRGVDGIYVENLSEVPLSSAATLTDVIDQGNKRRATSATLMNAASSRSHAVVILSVDGAFPSKTKPKPFHSKLHLVDLAGSERVTKSGATGESLKEAIAINQSLSCLGTVINALTDQRMPGHIPYRSSKLTHLLEDSLGGNSHTVMLAACSPSSRSYFETLSTMQYAARAKLIICNPKIHKHEEEKTEEEAQASSRKERKYFDWRPRYLRLDGYLEGNGVPRRAWLTGAEQREKVLMASPSPTFPPSPRRV